MGGQKNVSAGHLEQRSGEEHYQPRILPPAFMAWYALISASHHFSMLLRGTRALIPRLLMGRRMRDCDAFHFSQVQVLIRDRAEKSVFGICWGLR